MKPKIPRRPVKGIPEGNDPSALHGPGISPFAVGMALRAESLMTGWRNDIATIVKRIDDERVSGKDLETIERKLNAGEMEMPCGEETSYSRLTPTERKIYALMEMKLSNVEIAHLMRRSRNTIACHRHNIRRKLNE